MWLVRVVGIEPTFRASKAPRCPSLLHPDVLLISGLDGRTRTFALRYPNRRFTRLSYAQIVYGCRSRPRTCIPSFIWRRLTPILVDPTIWLWWWQSNSTPLAPRCKCYASVLPHTHSYRRVLMLPTRPPYLFLLPALPVRRFTCSSVLKLLHLIRGWLLRSLISAFRLHFRWGGGFP